MLLTEPALTEEGVEMMVVPELATVILREVVTVQPLRSATVTL